MTDPRLSVPEWERKAELSAQRARERRAAPPSTPPAWGRVAVVAALVLLLLVVLYGAIFLAAILAEHYPA